MNLSSIQLFVSPSNLVCDVYVDNTLDLSIIKYNRIPGTAKCGFISLCDRHFKYPNETAIITRSLKKSFYYLGNPS